MEIKQLYKLYQQHPCITTDSRDCPEGSIFLALKGESFDGNKFALAALEKGCSYAIIDDKDVFNASAQQQEIASRLILVDDCLQTFKDLAREHRRQFKIPVIGITGTNGKTTTKELIATVLQEKYRVLFTQGNFNNDVGVPKTLFRLTSEHEIAVIEMGASHPGDIKTLVETAEPNCGLITNVGRAHLQGFGSFEGVKRTKGELYDFLRRKMEKSSFEEGMIFINADDDDLRQMADERGLILQAAYGTGSCDDIIVKGKVESCAPFLHFSWFIHDEEEGDSEPMLVETHLIGAYNIYNMLAAITVGMYFDLDPEQINHALTNYIPSNNRSQLTVTDHNKLIVDAYNANPSSMRVAIDNFRQMQVGPKMAILGDMLELGEMSGEEHQRIADILGECLFDDVWLVGNNFANTQSSFRKFHDVEEVKAALREKQPENYYILIKGSNSTRLYQLPEIL
jgi:UDP-N-acetylmuramoyl-tripeptide--D-alanyl-D-alanine ligase